MVPTLVVADCCVFSLLIASSGGAFSSIRFLGMQQGQQRCLSEQQQQMTMRATPMIPPTTPPMMAFIEDEDELSEAAADGLDDVTTVTADTPL